MITKSEILDAMLCASLRGRYLFLSSKVKQIALSLNLYADRGEYDGTYESAVGCLKMAEYEIVNEK